MDDCNVLVNVQGTHVQNGDRSETEFLTEGRLTRSVDGYIIEYEESVWAGLSNSVARFVVHGEELWLQRSGEIETEYRLQERQTFQTAYRTPLGTMRMVILPTQIGSQMEPDSGRISLEYILTVGDSSALNSLDIRYQTKKRLPES